MQLCVQFLFTDKTNLCICDVFRPKLDTSFIIRSCAKVCTPYFSHSHNNGVIVWYGRELKSQLLAVGRNWLVSDRFRKCSPVTSVRGEKLEEAVCRGGGGLW